MMKKVVLGSAFVIAVVACGGFDADESPPTTTGADAGADGALLGAPPPPPPPPPPPLDGGPPAEDEITEKFGIFVAPGVPPGGDGSRTKPMATIKDGLAAAVAASPQKRLYVCEGTLKEQVTIPNGIPMVGGFECAAGVWKASTTKRTKVEAPVSPAVQATDITLATRVDGFEFVAPDATTPGGSSFGMIAKNAGALTLARSILLAGAGAPGRNGTTPAALVNDATIVGEPGTPEIYPTTADEAGTPSAWQSGGKGGVNTCGGKLPASRGVEGGRGGVYICRNRFSVYLWDVYGVKLGGGFDYVCTPGVPGNVSPGGPGAAGGDGISSSSGKLSPIGFSPGDGTKGADGQMGIAGGGGRGSEATGDCASVGAGALTATPGGGGGGAGGCPGLAGEPGGGGGASVAVLMISSPGLTFDASQLTAGAGGRGGRGSLGASPSPGAGPSAYGAPIYANASHGGGGAGPGGRAGVSGSGAGGPSYGVASSGGEATFTNVATARAGTGGQGVAAETKTDAVGNAVTLPASVAGEAKDTTTF